MIFTKKNNIFIVIFRLLSVPIETHKRVNTIVFISTVHFSSTAGLSE